MESINKMAYVAKQGRYAMQNKLYIVNVLRAMLVTD